jgi:acetyl coenzyme A synthetase (ADP forming)-like protein
MARMENPVEVAEASGGLRPLLAPRAIAVVGVSRSSRGIGRRILDGLHGAGFPGPVYAITRDGGEIDGHPTWRSVRALPAPVDLAVIAVERSLVSSVIDDCIAASVKAVVVISAGFAEADPAGRELQDALLAKVRAAGIRMVGPNCMGVLNADDRHPMNATFSPCFPKAGGLALSSQSGALGMVILDLASRRHVGISTFVSVGNKADVSSNDLLEYWAEDPGTSVIALYLESFGNPRRFAQIARAVGRKKPIIAVKSGRTQAGAAAAGSHTAALAANDTVVSALFHQTGVIRAETIDEMFDLAACLEAQPLPAGSRVAIVTNAGGPGILAADACVAAGLTVVTFSESTRAKLAPALSSLAVAANPLDMIATAGPEQYREAIATVLAAEEIDALLVLFTPVDPITSKPILDAIAEGIVRHRSHAPRPKPVLACLMADGGHPQLMAGRERIPVYMFPENAARALGKIARYAAWRAAPVSERRRFNDIQPDAVRTLCRSIIAARGADWLTSEETFRVLAGYGIQTVPTVPTQSAADAAAIAGVMGFPVVAKLNSTQALHKTDVEGVVVNLRTASEVEAAFDALVRRAASRQLPYDSITIQPMVTGGIEVVIGIVNDRLFGPLVGFGLGGVDVEALGDMHFRVTPINEGDLAELMNESRAWSLMAARRGRPPHDIPALAEVLARVSRLAEDVPEILELDLNPVIVLPAGHGCHVVDVRIRVGDPRPPVRGGAEKPAVAGTSS